MESFDPTDDIDCDLLLKDRDAKVIYCIEEPRGWNLHWKHGTASFGFHSTEQVQAHRTAALFIYLWEKGIGPCLANELARLFVNATR